MSEPGQPQRTRSGSAGAAMLGALLIVLGLIFLAGQEFNFDISAATWPLYVVVPGVALATLGLTQRRGSGLTIAGSVVAVTGLVLLYQNATDHWESWAYAWALVAPGGSGLGMLLYGTRSGDRDLARKGFWMILGALALFFAGLVFFEAIIGISGEPLSLPRWVLPAAVIAIGFVVLIRGLTFREHRGPAAEAEVAGKPEMPSEPAQAVEPAQPSEPAEPSEAEASLAPEAPNAES